jgi:hypothetical protein
LIAWKRLTKLWKHGGLGIKDSATHATALMARWPIKLITEKQSRWSKLFKANLENLPWQNKKKHCNLGYSFLDKLVYNKPMGFSKLQYSKNIWTVWEKLRKSLLYVIESSNLPSHWAIENALTIRPSSGNYTAE